MADTGIALPVGLGGFSVRIDPGKGAAIKATNAIALVGLPPPGGEHVVERMVMLLGPVGDGVVPARPLARQLAGLFAAEEPGCMPDFATVAVAENGLGVLLYGSVDAEIHIAGGRVERLSGQNAASWVDFIVTPQVEHIVLTLTKESVGQRVSPPLVPESISHLFDLRYGVVPARAVSLVSRHSAPMMPTSPPAQQTTESRAATERTFTAQSSYMPPAQFQQREYRAQSNGSAFQGGTHDQGSGPYPSAGQPGVASDWFLRMDKPPANAPVATGSAAPPHGLAGSEPADLVLVMDDGSVFTLAADNVAGREPGDDSKVLSGQAKPIPVPDVNGTVSRIHMELWRDGSTVSVLDRGSSSGTWVMPPGGSWQRLEPGIAVTIVPNTQLSVGARTMALRSLSERLTVN